MRRWLVGRAGLAAAATAAAALMATAAIATDAYAASWPTFGGDQGRSGFQAVDQGGVPVQPAWSRSGATDLDIRTSVVAGAGDANNQRITYGADSGRLIVRMLLTGAPVGPNGGTDVSSAANPFGGGSASVSPVVASPPTSTPGAAGGPGQVYAVVNERFGDTGIGAPGLQLVQIDEGTGARARDDITIDLAAGYVIESSPLLTPPDAADNRSLFFVARQAEGTAERLFRIDIGAASSRTSVIGAPSMSGDINANTLASPTLVWLRAVDGTPAAYVAVGTVSGLLTFRASDWVAGPSAAGLGENVRTPSTPVTASGAAPGSPGSGVEVAPVIYVASGGATTSTVHALTQQANAQALTVASSATIAGEAANALMTDARSTAAAPGLVDGRIYLTTSTRIASLRTVDLASIAAREGSFRNTTAVGTGLLVAVATDTGDHLVLDATTLEPVDPDVYAIAPASANGKTSFGQPAVSRRFLAFTSDRGIFVYSLRRATPPTGYWLVASDGGVFAYGDAGFFGSTGNITLNKPIVGTATTPTREGYWMVASDGGVFAFGDAGFFGSTGNMPLNSPVVAMAATPTGQGYWLVAADGGVFAFGDAVFLGSMGATPLNRPIVGVAVTITGQGYWLVASDGGIFAFGDAAFLGSMGDTPLNRPVVGMAADPNGKGYWMVASDGGVFTFGRARFLGSMGGTPLNSPIVAMAPSATGAGYLFTAADGGLFTFGDAPFLGSAASLGRLNRPVVALAVKP